MGKSKLIIGSLIFVLCILCSCNQNSHNNARVRIKIESVKDEKAEIYVCLENEFGESADGAFIYLCDDNNSITELLYNPDGGYYYVQKEVPNNNIFNIYVDSMLFNEIKHYTIKHEQLDVIPVVTVFCDENGNSVMDGKTLDSFLPIQIGWTKVSSDVVYKVSIKTATRVIYSVSTENNMVFIPAKTLPSESFYYLVIEAQKSSGDLLYKTDNYYSVSTCKSSNISFNVN